MSRRVKEILLVLLVATLVLFCVGVVGFVPMWEWACSSPDVELVWEGGQCEREGPFRDLTDAELALCGAEMQIPYWRGIRIPVWCDWIQY